MYSIVYSNQFKKSLKRCVKRGLDVGVLTIAVNILQKHGCLPAEYDAHKLKGNYVGYWYGGRMTRSWSLCLWIRGLILTCLANNIMASFGTLFYVWTKEVLSFHTVRRKSNLIIPIDSSAVESIIAEILRILLLFEGESGGKMSQSIDLSFEYHYS